MKALTAALALLAPGPALACGLELVLAMDVSRSVVNTEYDLQMEGLAAAFRDPAVIQAIEWTTGGVMVTVTQWSGPESQAQTVPWSHLQGAEDSLAFAEAIDRQNRMFFAAYTAIGEALFHAAQMSAGNPRKCLRRVIDVSGDGASNRGRLPRPMAEALAASGFTINALVIEGAKDDPVEFYRRQVVRGNGAFLEIARGFEDYARAIRAKLLREMDPQLAEVR
ncbi:DUF1194 domain-containing protein [Rhodobacteraceae bacterium NNCM2]|nr:DUF1194 domain-containing protein [Coraliihabitans acroporae]